MYQLIIIGITLFYVTVHSHVDDVFYIDSTTPTSVTIGWYGEKDADQHVKEWKVYINDEKRYYGSPEELMQTSSTTVNDNLGAEPGQNVKVKVHVLKSDDSIVYPLLNVYPFLKPLPVKDLMMEQEATSNDLAGSGTLSWTPGQGSHQDLYNVRYKGTYQTPTDFSEVQEVSTESLMFTGLVPGNLYLFQVTAKSGDAESDVANFEQELHPGHVTNVQMKSLADGLSLKWTMPPGIVHKMEAYVDPYDKRCASGSVNIHDDEEGAEIYGLSPACTYIIHVCAVSRNGLKGKSVDVAGTTVPKINSTIQLSEPATETSATLIYSETFGTFDYYYIKLNTKENKRPSYDKDKSDPYRSVTFTELIPGTLYNVELYTIVRQRAGAPAVGSTPFHYTFKTAGEPPSPDSSEINLPLWAVIVLSVLIVLLLIIVIILGICLFKSKRQTKNTQPGTINNKLNSNKLRHGSINAAGPQPTGQTSSYMEIVEDGRRNKDSMGYEQPVNSPNQDQEREYEKLRKSNQVYENQLYHK